MIWLAAIVVVLVLGGVALAAAGIGAPMVEEYDDRPDVVVPSGPLTGADLRRVRFSLAFRGYRMSEVDALLDRLAAQLPDPQLPDQQPPGQQPPEARPEPGSDGGAPA
ncbi:DivIVA domain-containing protein [Nocardioides sp.]|uniref:DivIVA domain-containing protein n=1 Tax=Nocardioides sp. TaxID=35761 RepID=UPI0035194F69